MSSNIYHNYNVKVNYIDIPIGVEYDFDAPDKSSKFFNVCKRDEKKSKLKILLHNTLLNSISVFLNKLLNP